MLEGFFADSRKIFGKIRIHAGGWEDNWESEKLQKLMKYKLKILQTPLKTCRLRLQRSRGVGNEPA